MADVFCSLGHVNVTLSHRLRVENSYPLLADVPGGLYPLKMSVYTTDDWIMQGGWPAALPKYLIQQDSLVSCTAEVMTSRPAPDEVNTSAAVRWIADDPYWDENGLTWNPTDESLGYSFHSSTEYMPALLENYQYRIGSERFYRTGLNFDSDEREHMWASFYGLPMTGYTVIMVVSPSSAFGNDDTVPYNGIWGFGLPTPTGDSFPESTDSYMNVTLAEKFLYLETEQSTKAQGPGIASFLSGSAPMYLAMVFTRPQARILVGPGPSRMLRASIPTGTDETVLDPNVVLGRTTGDVLHTADMMLFDVGLYPTALSDDDIVKEFAILSKVYGGDK